MPHASTIWRQMKKVSGAARVNKKKVHAHINRVETILEIKDGVTVIANHLN